MKWDATEASRGNFNFANADQVVAIATANGMKMRGHTLGKCEGEVGDSSNFGSYYSLVFTVTRLGHRRRI